MAINKLVPVGSRLNSDLTPSRIIEYLNRYIVSQDKAKRAVAIAMRNRLRRRVLPPEIAHEIMPKNILMVGPTGVGKTEIARRLATLSNAPFIKVEATKFTEVGYVGRDVETIIRDLMEIAVALVRKDMLNTVQAPALSRAKERLLDALLPRSERQKFSIPDFSKLFGGSSESDDEADDSDSDLELDANSEDGDSDAGHKDNAARERLRQMLEDGKLDDREVEVEVADNQSVPIMGNANMDVIGINISEMLSDMMPKRKKKRHMKVSEAMRVFQAEEADKLIDTESLAKTALDTVQEEGIVFLDELDKVVVRGGNANGPDVSREGVQRDLLPIVEGTTVQTRYGPVKTDHILFIAAGAFSGVKPSDLIPELQGRFPIRVELEPLSWENLQQILTEPENSLVKQYTALIGTEGTELVFTDDATAEIAKLASQMNSEMEDIGARRLHTMMEQLLEDISFEVCDKDLPRIEITAENVKERLSKLVENRDIRRYLL